MSTPKLFIDPPLIDEKNLCYISVRIIRTITSTSKYMIN